MINSLKIKILNQKLSFIKTRDTILCILAMLIDLRKYK